MRRTRIKKGDEVIVITGAEKGTRGRVLEVDPAKGTIVVEGVNVRKRAWKPGRNPNYPDGGIHEMEAAINASNVMILDPVSGEGSRIGVRYEEGSNGSRKRVRFSSKSPDKALPEQY